MNYSISYMDLSRHARLLMHLHSCKDHPRNPNSTGHLECIAEAPPPTHHSLLANVSLRSFKGIGRCRVLMLLKLLQTLGQLRAQAKVTHDRLLIIGVFS